MVVLDTNIIIDHLRRPSDDSVLSKLSKNYSREEIGISVISIQELYEGKSTASPTKENQMMAIIGQLNVLPYDVDVARLAGKIARDSEITIDLADAAIAATTIIHDAELCTLNEKHFQSIPGLKFIKSPNDR